MKKSILIILLLVNSMSAAYSVRFAVIGDYGEVCEGSKNVSDLVKQWNPDFIITTGDNNYPSGGRDTIDNNIGSLYSSYIYPYKGKYKQPLEKRNRFFPCLGNHDFETENALPYLEYFDLPDNKYYYDFVKENVHFFSLCSDEKCPDGISESSKQLVWVKKTAKIPITLENSLFSPSYLFFIYI